MSQRYTDRFTLPAKYFLSPDIFIIEQEQVFRQCWLNVGHQSEFSAGEVRAINVAGVQVLVTCDEHGAIHAMHNVCRHRGTQLLEEGAKTCDHRIRCPYHAWTYSTAGQLVAAPNMATADGFDVASYRLASIDCATWLGFVFVRLQPSAATLDESFDRLTSLVRPWLVAPLVVKHEIQYEVAANWKLLFQNYNECYHCPSVHPQLQKLSAYDSASNHLDAGSILGGPMMLRDDVETMSTTGRLTGKRFADLDELQVHQVCYFTIYPNMFLSLHPDFVLVHRLQPISPDKTQILCQFLYHADCQQDPSFDDAPSVEFWDTTNRQDWHVCELTQRGVSSPAYVPGPYSNLESLLAAFDEHYLSTLSSDSSA